MHRGGLPMSRWNRFCCCMVPLLIGAGAWWFVSWLITPRPIWTRTFSTDSFQVQEEVRPASQEGVVQIEELGKRLPDCLEFNVNGNQLFVNLLSRYPSHLELVVMDTGKTARRCTLNFYNHSRIREFPNNKWISRWETPSYDIHYDSTSRLAFFPKPLHSTLGRWDWLSEWLLTEWYTTKVVEIATNRVLISKQHSKFPFNHILTDNWLLLVQDGYEGGDKVYDLEVYALPLCTWSKAWGPVTGLFLMVFTSWWMRRWTMSAYQRETPPLRKSPSAE
jgi:hypothetical protein